MPATKTLIGLFSALLLALAGTAFAQQFAGQTVTMIVNYPAGGPTDIEARILARHLPKYLQGVSSVVVRNVGGAGGNIGVNTLGESSAKDRLNISFFTWDPVDPLIQHESLRVRYQDLKFVAGFQQVSMLYIRRDTPPGIAKPSDVVKAKLFKAGGLSPSNIGTTRQRLSLDLLGAKYESIPGYKGVRDIEVAMRQGDIQVTFTSLPSWYGSVKPQLIDTGIALPLFQYDYDFPDGTMGRSPEFRDVPTFLEVYKEVHGKGAMPSGEKWEILHLLSKIMDNMFRTVFMPPIAPPAAVAEMRAAMEKLEKDGEFIADYEKVVRTKPRLVIGARGERFLADLGNVPPPLVAFLRKFVAAAR
ncbi:MAG: hypothetical protein HYU75_13305 [Betaproteobacteria bacterium]|nr:hypothetical protein [Betaproteobacteria bacterium]